MASVVRVVFPSAVTLVVPSEEFEAIDEPVEEASPVASPEVVERAAPTEPVLSLAVK